MTRRGRGLAVLALLVVAVPACERGVAKHPPARTAKAVAPHPTTTTRPVPRPPTEDRGSNYVAIARSLVLYGRRLETNCPDAALVNRAYAPGSALARGMAAVCHAMHREQRYIVEVDREPLQLSVVSAQRNVVSFRLVEHLARRELVDRRGRVIQRRGPATETYVVSMLRFSARDPWRLNDVHRLGPRVEVRL